MTAEAPRIVDVCFRGANWDAFVSEEPEILLAGPAGTGKSVTLLHKCLHLLDEYPGARGLFCRGTRSSLTQSGLVTWEDKVLGRDDPLLTRRPMTRRVRQSYMFENGSEFVVAGLDDPGKTLSTEYDFVYIQEATEDILFEHYDTLLRCLRNGVTPYTQIMADCNPTTPTHWIYQRHLAGRIALYTSRHEDNPVYFDLDAGTWTPAGAAYLKTLERMSGTRRNRFLLGRWVVAEGLVYDYDPERHLLPADWHPPANWKRVWGIDWGLSAPTVLSMYAVDEAGRMYLYREAFRTHQRPDTLGKWAKLLIQEGKEPTPYAIVCDHDDKNRRQFEDASGLSLQLADKADRDRGIETTQARFDSADDGRPRIFFKPNARDHEADTVLADSGTPASTLEEICSYTWEKDLTKDRPIDYNDHGCDVCRYVSRFCDNNLNPLPPRVGPAPRPELFGRLPAGTFRRR